MQLSVRAVPAKRAAPAVLGASMRRTVTGLIVVVLMAGFALWAKGCLDVDRCLDKGGRWNYELDECEH